MVTSHIFFAALFGFTLALAMVGIYLLINNKKSGDIKKTISKSEITPTPFQKKVSSTLSEPYSFENLKTLSSRVKEILKSSEIIAASSSTVLIEGESGTGKERMAKAIHNNGRRKNEPFIAVHIASLTDNLLESELFGHEKGAYTGAISQRKGRFELAHGGTLFLDEVGELNPMTQIKLLRVLQERCFERVGGNDLMRVDVRVIAATNRPLSQLVTEKKFREDLYYRLNVINLKLIPLRKRLEDLELLIKDFIQKHATRQNKNITGYTKTFFDKLKGYDFPGNIRELENLIERAVVFCQDTQLDEAHFQLPQLSSIKNNAQSPVQNLDQFEKKIDRSKIVEAYYQSHGNKADAARKLEMKESTYRYHLKKALEMKEEAEVG